MARKPAVGHGMDTAVYEEADLTGAASATPTMPDPSGFPPDGTLAKPSSGRRAGRSGSSGSGSRRWGGSGGRWWIWVGRLVLWALILVILVNGIRAPFERFTSSDSGNQSTPKAAAGSQFPSSAGSAFALQFGNVYLNYNQQAAAERERQLQAFLPNGAAGQFGWNGVGAQQVQSVQVAGVDARDASNAIVTLLARTADGWFRLAVPVYADNGAMVISGRPALLPPPTRATLPQGGAKERDTTLEAGLKQTLDAFFHAYAASEQEVLSRLSEGPAITGLNGSVRFARLEEIVVPKGAGDRRTISVTVTWQIPTANAKADGAELAMTYELTVVKKADGTWNVRDIHGATHPTAS